MSYLNNGQSVAHYHFVAQSTVREILDAPHLNEYPGEGGIVGMLAMAKSNFAVALEITKINHSI